MARSAISAMIWCLHGAVGRAGDWDEFASAMVAKGLSCRGVELWRFLECEGIGLVEWAAAFNAEVRAAGEEENILVGYSMGGRLALHALLDAPDLWGKAVLVSAHPGLLDERERLERMAGDAEWAGLALTSDWTDFLDRWNAQGVLQGVLQGEGAASRELRMRLVSRRRAIARSFMEWSLGKQADLRGRLGEVACPVLWLTGERDEKFTKLAHEAVPLFSDGIHHQFAGVGHRLPWQASAPFQEAVSLFLKGERA